MKILVWKGKHTDRYYDASTVENLEAAARSIITELLEIGYIYRPSPRQEVASDVQELLNLTQEEVAALPEAVKTFTQEKLQRHHALMAADEAVQREWERAQAHKRGEKTGHLVMARNDARWAKGSEQAAKKPEVFYENEEGIFRRETAWSFLQARSGL